LFCAAFFALASHQIFQESEMFVDVAFFCFEDIREKDDVCLVVLGNNCWLKQELTYDDYNP